MSILSIVALCGQLLSTISFAHAEVGTGTTEWNTSTTTNSTLPAWTQTATSASTTSSLPSWTQTATSGSGATDWTLTSSSGEGTTDWGTSSTTSSSLPAWTQTATSGSGSDTWNTSTTLPSWTQTATSGSGTSTWNTTTSSGGTSRARPLATMNVRGTTATAVYTGFINASDEQTQIVYELCASATNGGTSVCGVTTTNQSYTFTGLTPNSRYTWTVRPKVGTVYGETIGGSLSFTTLQADPLTSLPSVFYQNTSNATDTTVFVSWTSSNPNNRSMTYVVCASKDQHTVLASCSDQTTATSHSLSGLEPGTTYYYTIVADDGLYKVIPTESLRIFTTTGIKPGSGPYLYLNGTSGVTSTNATLTWQSYFGDNNKVMQYCLSTDIFRVALHCTTVSSTQAVLSSLQPNTEYFWNARVKDGTHGYRMAFDGPLSFRTSLSTINTNPTVSLSQPSNDTLVSTSQVDLQWNGQDSNNDTLTYRLYVKTVPVSDMTNYSNADVMQSGFERSLVDTTRSTYVLTGLSTNTKYWWTVTVNDSRGGGEIVANNGPYRFSTSSSLTNTGNITNYVIASTSPTSTTGVSDFGTGVAIYLNYVVTNNTSSAQVLNFNNNQLTRFTIKQLPSGSIVRLSSDGRTYNGSSQTITVPANSSIVVDSYTWDGSTYSSGARVNGTYEVSGQLFASNVSLPTPTTFVFILRDTSNNVVYVNNGGGYYGGPYYGGGSSSSNDLVTALKLPATEREQVTEWFGPVNFEDANGIATITVLHSGQGMVARMERGTVVTNKNGTRFVGTYQPPKRVELSKIAEPMRSKLPNATELSIFGVQYGNLNEKYSKPVVVTGTFSDDPRNLVSNPNDFAIMAWDMDTETWTKIGGIQNFTGKNFQVSLDTSTIFGFFNMKGKGFTGSTPESPVVSTTCRGNMPTPFADANSHWASYYICRLYRDGAITGYTDGPFAGTFQPNRYVSRAELLKTIMEVHGIPLDAGNATGFKDVGNNEWFTPYVAKAKQLGIIGGYPDGTFRPHAEVNRAEALKMILLTHPSILQSTIDGVKLSEDQDGDNIAGFADVKESLWYAPYISFAKKIGVVGGKADGLFHPSDKMTRGEMTKVLLLSTELSI